MMNPVVPQIAPVVISGAQPDTNNQTQIAPTATKVQATAQTEKNTQQYHRWPNRPQPGDLHSEPSSIDSALEQLNENMRAWATGVRFDVDPDTQRLVVSLVDNESGDVIRTVPSDAVLQISKMIAQFQGNGINTKA